MSFAFSNAGKKAKDLTFEEYGGTFTKEDVITSTIDFESEPENVSISFAKNGESLGQAFSVPKADLNGKALFPHISSRNVKFEVNFGKNKDDSAKDNFFPKPEEYKMAAECLESAERGMARYIFGQGAGVNILHLYPRIIGE